MVSDPASADEYLRLFHERLRTSGFGFEVTQHSPCPFCAAADWMVCRILDVEDRMRGGAITCSECGRTGRFLVERTAAGLQFEFVQTGGPDPAPWLEPKPRRLSPEEST